VSDDFNEIEIVNGLRDAHRVIIDMIKKQDKNQVPITVMALMSTAVCISLQQAPSESIAKDILRESIILGKEMYAEIKEKNQKA